MSLEFAISNYGGKVGTTSTYVKTFNPNIPTQTWIYGEYNNGKIITTAIPKTDVYIQKDLYIEGNIVQLSDERFKQNIEILNKDACDLLMHVNPCKYEFIGKADEGQHYGFIAQEVEKLFPALVKTNIDVTSKKEKKAVNYLEFIPLLLLKIQDLQMQIDELRLKN
uniref:Peptidase S74 domain-containing protein n=1 Tax=viral metagenome TaxID=1070528 RepID=A0A6C0F459_9ZZZZ